MENDSKKSCIHYDETEKNGNNGLPCKILKGKYYTYDTGNAVKTLCLGRFCRFYRRKEGIENESAL